MTVSKRRPSSRDKLLDAAISIVTEHGVQLLTIEATAAVAGVTKAGLIYHFKTRDELLMALVERMAGEIELQSSGVVSGEASISPKTLIENIEKYAFDMPARQKRLLSNMLVAICGHPNLVSPAQALYERSYKMLDNAPDCSRALVLLAALDGFLLLEMLNLYTFTSAQREALRSELADLGRDLN